ncbi:MULTISPECIES: hypothetical protein [Aeromonas]|jgi:hypothetical protein|uniref:Uncharacterized protein n=1 Tax=Aeromonas media TaxID=651 RepID=A0AAW5RIA1_AERME|nr:MULTISPECIES: hypothetical protein [Aeromonas]MBP6166264.1 hypothetical protein [Aeromonas sp.]AHX62030.1 hypothetical protein B224_3814 [Aeromonas media WS]MBP8112223.1 hypothetical protein [Aeromonas sp.]MBP8152143.1 hypothetical protein [Aeromonas sp.]MBP8188306.1 hypothetical protein [Aeromonas sp.]
MGYITAFLPARAGLRQPSVLHIGAPNAQADITVTLIPSARMEKTA